MYFLVLFKFFHLDFKKFSSKKCKYIFFDQKFVHLGENASTYCSRMIVVHVHATVFFSSKFAQRVTILQTVSNQEATLKRLIKACCGLVKSCILGRKVIYVRCINCSYNNVAKCIRLLHKKHLLFIQEIFHTRKSF